MGVFEGIHDNLLQGVSQQVPRSRLAGQLTLQENMLSDPVTGLRRRAGSVIQHIWEDSNFRADAVISTRTDIGGVSCSIVVDTSSGSLYLIENQTGERTKLVNDYFKTNTPQSLRFASVGDSLYVANIEKIPVGVSGDSGKQDPAKTGYYYIRGSALSTTFTIVLRWGGGQVTATYTTPDGTQPEHIGQSTPDYIADNLAHQLIDTTPAELLVERTGNIVSIRWVGGTEGVPVSVTTDSSSLYILTSNTSEIRNLNDLPPRLHAGTSDGFMMATGTPPNLTYYRYDATRTVWSETGAYGSVESIKDAPVEIYWDNTTGSWAVDSDNWAGRKAGDDHTNPNPDFIDWGITGVGSYQGRLVILSGSWVWLSATNQPRQFYRSTVNDLLDTDPIGIGSSAATSAAFQYAVPFNKDLILFSKEFQALISGGAAALTPRNASIVITSTYSADMLSPPVTLGRSIMYPIPRSQNFFGVLEMMPSPYSDSQYISTDSTEHIPRYMAGRCRFAVASSVSSIVLFGSSQDTRAVYVHEYMWDGEDKVLRAWHRWSFKYPVAHAYFNGELINIITVNDGVITICSIDPRSGLDKESGDVIGYMDYIVRRPVTKTEPLYDEVILESALVKFYNNKADLPQLRVGYSGGDLDGYELGSESNGVDGLRLNKSNTAEFVTVGMPFVSMFAPSPPIMRGEDELPINTNKMTLVRYYITTEKSGDFVVSMYDSATQTEERSWDVNPVTYDSAHLNLGKTPVNGEVGNVIPCRINASSGTVLFKVDGLTELNVLSLEYVCRYNQRIRRR